MQAPGEKTNIICQGLIVNILHLITATSIIYTSIYLKYRYNRSCYKGLEIHK